MSTKLSQFRISVALRSFLRYCGLQPVSRCHQSVASTSAYLCSSIPYAHPSVSLVPFTYSHLPQLSTSATVLSEAENDIEDQEAIDLYNNYAYDFVQNPWEDKVLVELQDEQGNSLGTMLKSKARRMAFDQEKSLLLISKGDEQNEEAKQNRRDPEAEKLQHLKIKFGDKFEQILLKRQSKAYKRGKDAHQKTDDGDETPVKKANRFQEKKLSVYRLSANKEIEELQRKFKKQRKQERALNIKERNFNINARITEKHLVLKIYQCQNFLLEGDIIRLSIHMGWSEEEKARTDYVLDRFQSGLSSVAKYESFPVRANAVRGRFLPLSQKEKEELQRKKEQSSTAK